MTHASERGYTLVEVLVSVVITVLLAFVALAAVRAIAGTMRTEHATQAASASADELTSQLERDADSAFGVYVPADTTCNGTQATVVDFYYKTNASDIGGSGTTISYTFANGTLTRSVSGAATTTTALQTFGTQCIRATSLNAQYPVELGPLAGKQIDNPVSGDPNTPGADGLVPVGGNRIVEVTFANAYAARTVRLMAGSVATGFTLDGPQWHTIVWAEDHLHRGWFGFSQVSWIQIWARVDVSWDSWQTEKPWCQWEAAERYGPQPKFDKNEIPYVNTGNGPFSRNNTGVSHSGYPDFLPLTLFNYCRANPAAAGSTTGSLDPPGPTNGNPLPFNPPGGTNPPPNPPSWFIWQYCNHARPGTPIDPASCDPSANVVDGCDTATVGDCTITANGAPIPSTPPEGWTAWCATYSTTVPGFGAPCSTPTPSPRSTPGCYTIRCCGGGTGPISGPIAQSVARSPKTMPISGGGTIDPCCVGDGTCDPGNGGTDPTPSPTDTPAPPAASPSPPAFAGSDTWLADCDAAYGGTPADTAGAPTDLSSYTWTGSIYMTSTGTGNGNGQFDLYTTAPDYFYAYEYIDSGQQDQSGNEIYNSQYACVQRTS